jgi:ketosteroid isomerase-like protein
MVRGMIDHHAAVTNQILELGRHWANAERAGDADALEPLLADDFLLVGPLGFMLDKTPYLGSRRSGDLRHESLAWEDIRVRAYDNAAVTVGSLTQRSTYQGRDASGRFRVTQVAVRDSDRWTIVGLHYSPIAQPPESAASPSNAEPR